MLELTTKQELARTAKTLAQSHELVQYRHTTYVPTNWITGMPGPGAPHETVWMPMDRDSKRRLGNQLGKILFANDSEITNFDIMLRQFSNEQVEPVTRLLIKTSDGLRVLTEDGELALPTPEFLPNFITAELNDDPEDKQHVFNVIKEWLDSEDEARSLLYHLATALSPGWSAVKYILLIGSGRNGKSVLLSMLADLFGMHNISSVTRQQMADRMPTCVELNGKLLNIIMDGEMAYIKDSSMEKTLIAGERAPVRLLYENGNTMVQTNALFLEALNSEPKTRDKSAALQKRLSRFVFPNTFEVNRGFEKHMRSEKMLGAFLSLLLDHFVKEDEIADKLKQTEESVALQVEQQIINSPLLQYLQYLILKDPAWINRFTDSGAVLDPLVDGFMAWRLQEGHGEYSSADIRKMFGDYFTIARKSVREDGKVMKKGVLGLPKSETLDFIEQLKGEVDGLQPDAVVAD